RVSKLTDPEHIFVVSEASHSDHVIDQLSDIPEENILIEPARRGTASCFLLALNTIKQRGLDDQAIFFLWSDHIVPPQPGFVTTAGQYGEIAEMKGKIVFIGIDPTYTSIVL